MKTFLISMIIILLSAISIYAQDWYPTNPINPLDVRDMAIERNGNLLCAVAGSVTGGFTRGAIFISRDYETWRPFWNNDDHYALTSLAVNDSGDIFVGSDSGGVYRTTDGGTTWETINNGLTSLRISRVNADKPGYLFACSKDSGVFRSTDNGNNWIKINNDLTSTYIEAFMVNGNGDIFCGANYDPVLFGSGIFRSTDNGDTWLHPVDGVVARDFTINPVNNYHFAVVSGAVYYSMDQGVTWDFISSGSYRAIAADEDGNLYAGGGSAGGYVYKSTDNGMTWNQFYNGFLADVNGIKVVPVFQERGVSNKFYVDMQILIKTTAGLNGKNLNTQEEYTRNLGLSEDEIRAFGFRNALSGLEDNILLAGSNKTGAYYTQDPIDISLNWLLLPSGASLITQPKLLAIDNNTGKFCVSGSYIPTEYKIIRYNTYLSPPEDITNGLPNQSMQDLEVDSEERVIAAFEGVGVWVFENGIFVNKSSGLPLNETISAIGLDLFDRIYAGVTSGLFRSSPGGGNFVRSDNGLPPNFIERDFVFDDYFGYAVGNLGIYYSDDGENWAQYDMSGLPPGVGLISIDEYYDAFWDWSFLTVVTADGRVFKYDPWGWNDVTDYNFDWDVLEIETRRMWGEVALFIGTNYGLYYKFLSPPTAIHNLDIKPPMGFTLLHNYPNPFNSSTTIRYQLPARMDVSLKIFDITGHEIRTLVKETLNAGEHSVTWNGTNNLGIPVSSGIYLYQLKAGNRTESRRMLLLK